MTETNREDLAEKASEFLLGVLERMGISADIDIKDDTDKTVLEIQTGDTELVIGRRGVVIDALQHLVNKAVFKETRDEKTKPIVVDAGGFRDKQVERLRALAQKMAREGAADEADRRAAADVAARSPHRAHGDRRDPGAVERAARVRAKTATSSSCRPPPPRSDRRADDTIAAIATAAGIGGVGIVRVSGPRAIAIARERARRATR